MRKAGEASVVAMLTIYSLIFDKMDSVDMRAMSRINVGDLSNNITNDILRVVIAIFTGHQMIISPMLVTVYIIILILNIQYSALAGLLIIILIMFLNTFLSTVLGKLTAAKLKLNGLRNKEINFSIGGIKTIKFNGWEQITMDFLNDIRQKEKSVIRKILFLGSFSTILTYTLPSLAGFVCITIYNSTNDNLSIANIFFIITIFNLLVTPLRVFFFGTMTFFEARVSLKRISKMLLLPDIKDEPEKFYLDDSSLPKGNILFNGASFSYFDKNYEQRVDKTIKDAIGELNPKKGRGKGPTEAKQDKEGKIEYCVN
jgi:ATP-binding cassette subfamily C (CFTR/MRP) protein 10